MKKSWRLQWTLPSAREKEVRKRIRKEMACLITWFLFKIAIRVIFVCGTNMWVLNILYILLFSTWICLEFSIWNSSSMLCIEVQDQCSMLYVVLICIYPCKSKTLSTELAFVKNKIVLLRYLLQQVIIVSLIQHNFDNYFPYKSSSHIHLLQQL